MRQCMTTDASEEIKLSNLLFCSEELEAYFPDRQHVVRIKITSTAK